MPINVFGNSSRDNNNKIDTSLFVQKPYLRTNYLESNIEEDIDLKINIELRIYLILLAYEKQLPKIMLTIYLKNDIDFNDAMLENIKFVKVNYQSSVDEHLTPKDNAIDESSLVRNNKDNAFGKYNMTNINSITLNIEAENDNQVITKAYVDQFHQEKEISRRDLGIDFCNESSDLVKNNQDNNLNDIKLTIINSITVNNNPIDDNHVCNKKYIDDELDKSTIVRFNQTLQNYLKVSIGSDKYILTKYDKMQLTDVTEIKYLNTGSNLLQKWNIICSNKYTDSRIGDFKKSTKTNSPTGHSGATTLPPIGNSFMFIETSGNNSGNNNVFVSWGRTDIIQISNITFCYNRFSILTDDSQKSMEGLEFNYY